MTISIEVASDSDVMVLQTVGEGPRSFLVPLVSPGGDKVILPSQPRYHYLMRVPLVKPVTFQDIVVTEEARSAIPVGEVIGKNLEAYIVESLPAGQGGSVNSQSVKIGTSEEDLGVIFTAL